MTYFLKIDTFSSRFVGEKIAYYCVPNRKGVDFLRSMGYGVAAGLLASVLLVLLLPTAGGLNGTMPWIFAPAIWLGAMVAGLVTCIKGGTGLEAGFIGSMSGIFVPVIAAILIEMPGVFSISGMVGESTIFPLWCLGAAMIAAAVGSTRHFTNGAPVSG